MKKLIRNYPIILRERVLIKEDKKTKFIGIKAIAKRFFYFFYSKYTSLFEEIDNSEYKIVQECKLDIKNGKLKENISKDPKYDSEKGCLVIEYTKESEEKATLVNLTL